MALFELAKNESRELRNVAQMKNGHANTFGRQAGQDSTEGMLSWLISHFTSVEETGVILGKGHQLPWGSSDGTSSQSAK